MAAKPRVGIILLQLGTPDAPTPRALRRYLRQFLSDRRVVDLWRPLWWVVLNAAVLPRRPRRSAELYARIWTDRGSPLALTSEAQASALELALGDVLGREAAPEVVVGMRYGKPSVEQAVERLLAHGCDRILAFPMYPQYASATTGSSLEELMRVLAPRRVVPSVRVVPPYFDDPAYVDALVASAGTALGDWTPDHLVMSFHGIPQRYAALGDPYPQHCERTAAAFVERFQWPAERFTLSYQSLFGREEWLRPYTDHTLTQLASRRLERLAVMCPGFTADCLETLEEIGMTGRKAYQAAGGREYRLIPCLNVHPSWIEGMRTLVLRELAGWI